MAVERFADGMALGAPGQPVILTDRRAKLACGCGCYVGIRLDTFEAATAAVACGPAHQPLMEHFTLLLRESLVEPIARPMVDVADELLLQAARHRPDVVAT